MERECYIISIRNSLNNGSSTFAWVTALKDAAIPCEAIVQGQGRLMAFATADFQDREPKTSPRVTTWKGRALLVVRSTIKKGKAKVTIKSDLPTATLSI